MEVRGYDLFGQALQDYMDGERDGVIRVDTTITADEELPVEYLMRGLDEMPDHEQLALKESRGRILDVGAGSGSHSLELQNMGKSVVGLDYSPKCCDVMRRRGVENVLDLDFYRLIDDEGFDTLLFLMNGTGMAQRLSGLERLLNKCKELLRPGGQILMESADLIYMFEEEDGSAVIDLNASYYGELDYMLTYKGKEAESFQWLYVGYDLLADACSKADLQIELLHEGEEYSYLARITPN